MDSSRQRFFDLVEQYIYKPNCQTTVAKPKRELVYHKHHRASSKCERYVLEFIQQQQLQFDREKEFPGLADNRPLRFDFFLPDLKFLIEVDGSQHYQGSVFHSTREEWLKQIRHDEMKNEYCRKNGINLLRIPCICTKDEAFRLIHKSIADIRWGKTICEVDVYFQKKAGIFKT
jgi:very-short-patch-repair endonuclease